MEQQTKKNLLENYRKDLALSEFSMKNAISNIEDWVKNNENQRNYKMKSEFEREKEYKLEEQAEIKNQIEQLASNNINERLINHFNNKINQQQELYNKYYEMREEINSKIKFLKETIPELEVKVNQKSEKLKQINKENLKLMEQISQMEKSSQNTSTININTISNSNININNPNSSMNTVGSDININKSLQISNEKIIPNSINIKELVEENEQIRAQYKRILMLKKQLILKRKENEHLSRAITEMNSDCFSFKKIFTEGMHEIAKELLKIHEIQLDKVIASSNNTLNNSGSNLNNSGSINNSLYFEIVKGNINGNEAKNDDTLKLPIIHNNIMKKYNYPIVEKTNPTSLVYQVIKNMLEESHNLNKVVNMKKNKFSWDEFKKFSAYQIYTILNLNKEVIKKIEAYIFPRKIIIPNEEEKSFQSNEFEDN